MARPPEPEKKLELARAAVEVLQREGLEVSMKRLADVLGIKRPTLIYHFPTKGHIVETALEDLLREQAVFVLARVAEQDDPLHRLHAQICAVHEFHRGREARVVFLSQAIAATGGERMREIIDVGNRVFEPYRRAAADAIRRGVEDGTIAPVDADALIALVRAVTDGLMVQRVMTGLDLAPVHQLLWDQLFGPLLIDRTSKKKENVA